MKRIILFFVLAAAASAAPVIRSGTSGIVNAASYIPLGAQGKGIAQGSFFVIFGSGLGPSTIAIAEQPYPTTTGGTTVTITPAGGSPVSAFLYYAVDGQVSGILPSTTPTGTANVTVTYNGSTSAPVKITVVKSDFGIFTLNQAGSGPAAILNRNLDGTSPINSLTASAAPGQILELYGTGLGPITGDDSVAPGAVSPAGIDVKVLVAGQSITPIYAGRSPAYPGLDQLDFQIAADATVPDSCFVPIAVSVNGVVSNYATFAKTTTGTTCPAPLGLPTAALQKLDAGGKINVGLLSLSRSTIQASAFGFTVTAATEHGGGTFASLDAAGVFGLIQTPGAMPPLNPSGTCLVQTQDAITPPPFTVPAVPQPLNAGTKLTLTGPNSKSHDLPPETGFGYGAFLAQSGASIAGISLAGIAGIPKVPDGTPASFLEAGQWTISGAGGSDIGAFSATATVPAALACQNCNFASIDRTKPLTINWTGGGTQDYVQIGGFATTPSLGDSSKNVAVVFTCTAKLSDGTFTVPVSILGQLPTSSADPLAANTGALAVVNGSGNAGAGFTAPGIDVGYFGYTSLLFKAMGYN